MPNKLALLILNLKVELAKNNCSEETEENKEKLDKIAKVNIQISTLINYLNNPRAPIAKSKINLTP